MQTSPVTVTFPASPEFLRLARIATADAASRAGLDYEEIDDVRIAVSELCSVVSLDQDATITLSFAVAPGVLEVSGVSATGTATVAANKLSQAIIAAVVDEHTLDTDAGQTCFHVTKRARRTGS
jgi:hypothetical protein